MKNVSLSFIAAIVFTLVACKSTKSTSAGNTQPAATDAKSAEPAKANVSITPIKASDGVYAPGNDELSAIQSQFSDVTLDKLYKGYSLYSQSACLQCHQPKNIYRIDEDRWKDICDNMSKQANISEEQKDAVYKYVLAVKAVKAKSGG